jgi:DNA processing protein
MNETFDLLTLTLLPEVGTRAARDLLRRGALAESLRHADDHGDLLPSAARSALRDGAARRRADAETRRAAAAGVAVVGCDDPVYPAWLRRTYDPPPVLYVKGRLVPEEGEGCIAIVGSRAASPQGLALARALGRDLAAANATVVSGLARGIDTAAHRGALDVNGRTVAVLGSGLDRIYPPENASLAEAIAHAGGAVVSEFALGTAPHKGNFPRRNRVIAGWGKVVVVVEASAKSGALGTARAALDEGRDVLAVPGHPSAAQSEGTNQLIRDGAGLVRNAADVASEVGLVMPVTAAAESGADPLLDVLRRDVPMTLEDLQARSGRPIPDLLAQLGLLEIEARVRRLPGSLYVRN